MGGKVPETDMTPERVELLWRAEEADQHVSKAQLLVLVERLSKAARECPRTSCAFCEHVARSEAEQVWRVGEAEAG